MRQIGDNLFELANGARGQYKTVNGKRVFRITQGADKAYMDRIRAQKTGVVYGRGMAKGTPRRPVSEKAGARLLRAAHLRRAGGDVKKATRSMRSDMARARSFALAPGSAESIRYRQITGPLRYDLRGVDFGKASHDARRYKAGVRSRTRGKVGARTAKQSGRAFASA